MNLTKNDGMLEKVRDKAPAVGDTVSSLPAKEFVIPGVLGLAGAVAAKKAPDLVRGLKGSLEEKGEEEAQDMGRKALEGAKNALPGGGGSGTKKTRRLPIQRWTDVAVPVDKAFEAWTKFDQFPKFMHRVLNVEGKGDKIRWQEKIWFSKRDWEGQITDRRKNDRIAWKTTSGMSHRGIVSFHKIDDNLTRVMVDIEFEPNGMIEKMASGLRFVKRAVQADLARYKAFVEMEDAKGIEYRSGNGGRPEGSHDKRDRESARRKRENGRSDRRRSVTGKR